MSSVIFAGDAAVAVTLPTVAGVLSSPVHAGGGGGVAADAAPVADAGMVTAGVTVLPDAGNELPADLAGVATMWMASLADVGEVALGVTDSAVAGSVLLPMLEGCFRPSVLGKLPQERLFRLIMFR